MKFKIGDRAVVINPECKAIIGLGGVIVDAFDQNPQAGNMYTIEIEQGGKKYQYTVFENEIA